MITVQREEYRGIDFNYLASLERLQVLASLNEDGNMSSYKELKENVGDRLKWRIMFKLILKRILFYIPLDYLLYFKIKIFINKE